MKTFGTLFLIYLNCMIGIYARFAYEVGKCEISIYNVVRDMFKTEVQALFNPRFRNSSNKSLQYDLYTSTNPFIKEILKIGDIKRLKYSSFNASWPVRFSIHGWAGKSISCSNAAIKDAYLARGNFNVIVVDWSAYALDISYTRISKQLFSIAKSFVKFVHFLHEQTGTDYEQMYLIGHSAGSHIAGLSGKILKPKQFGAIFALDPAGLNQLNWDQEHRLSPNDALYVESIHSDVTLLGNPSTQLSHAAFFANWGRGQPHCPNLTAAEFDFACDHFAALYYFADSVRNPKIFGAVRCSAKSIKSASCGCINKMRICTASQFMGGEPAIQKSGVFYFSTQSQQPFGYGNLVHISQPLKSTILESNVYRKLIYV